MKAETASRTSRWGRRLLLPLLGLLVLELVGQLLIFLKPDWLEPPAHWARADALQGQAWIDDYFTEWWQSYRVGWASYTYWRRLPFQGAYIKIDEDGVRRSWQADPVAAAETPPRVFMLGGSTLWGFGARDDHTIPSCLARSLAGTEDLAAEVINLGETGYVSTQGMLTLLRRLQEGDIPDLVICYDGINDVFSSYQCGEAGIPQNEYRRRKEFNLLADNSGRTGYLVGAAGYRLFRQSALLRWTETLSRLVAPPHLPGSFAPPPAEADVSRLAEQTAAVYLANVRMMHALANQFGFDLLCVWQPTLFNKPVRSDYEAEQAEAFAYLEELYLRTTSAVRDGRDGELEDTLLVLTEVFEDQPEPLFLDFCHINEAGNEQVAQALSAPVAERLRSVSPTRSPTP